MKINPSIPYHLGCTGWSIPEWRYVFYKGKTNPSDFLAQYSSVFNSVEGNTTFYSVPDSRTIRKWGEQSAEGFKFCFKFPRIITHIKKLRNVEEEVLGFIHLFEPIREKLGPFMIQFPGTFTPNELHKLEQLLSILPKTNSYAVEVRHLDFFDRGKNEHNLDTMLTSYGANRMVFDTRRLHASKSQEVSILEAQKKKPKVPVRFQAVGTRPIVRFVGTNDVLNSEAHLKEWAIVVADWIKEGLHPYIFIHTPDVFSQPKLCAHFHTLLGELIDIPDLPEWPVNRKAQLGLF